MLPVARLIGHKEWAPGRKSDPRYSMDWMRGLVAAFRPRPAPEDDVPLTKTDVDAVVSGVKALFATGWELPAVEYVKGKKVGPARVYRWWQHSAAHAEKASEGTTALLAAVEALRGEVAALREEIRGSTGAPST